MNEFRFSNDSLTFRRINELDERLLYKIFKSTRENEIKLLSFWTKEQKEAFFWQQFKAQDAHYRSTYKEGDFWIIKQQGEAIGRLYLDRKLNDFISIVDIALLPEFRKKGIGEGLLRDILDYALTQKKSVRIHVENRNPAQNLYKRLGFTPFDEGEIYTEMRWTPQQ